MNKNLVALVLAGGEGKRFWPIKTSKSMIQFLGKHLLVHNLNRLKLTGITDIIIVVHPQDKEIYTHLTVPGLNIHIVVQPQPNGMAGAVLAASSLIEGRSCFVMNAEDLVEERLYKELASHLSGESIVSVGRKVTQYFPGSYFVFDGTRVIGVVEKPGRGNEPSDVTGLVFDYFPDPKKFIELLKTTKSDKDDIYEKALNELLRDGKANILRYDGYWFPTKYPWQILDIMNQMLLSITDFRGKNIEVKSNVVIEGPVSIGDNVQIFENTKIVGPCYIGANTIIGNNNIIRNSHIGSGCVSGFNTDITRSYVGDACWFHSNYVGDSVLEGNVSMGSGAVLANLRLDEGEIFSVVKNEKIPTGRTKLGAIIGRNVRIGVNASIMPGVKIGRNSSIGSGIVVDHDISDQSFCFGTSTLTITPNKFDNASLSRDELKKTL